MISKKIYHLLFAIALKYQNKNFYILLVSENLFEKMFTI